MFFFFFFEKIPMRIKYEMLKMVKEYLKFLFLRERKKRKILLQWSWERHHQTYTCIAKEIKNLDFGTH